MNNPLQGVLGHLELLIETSADAAPAPPRSPAHLPRSGSRGEDRPQSAGVRRLAPDGRAAGCESAASCRARSAAGPRRCRERPSRSRATQADDLPAVLRGPAADAPGVSEHPDQRRARHPRHRPGGTDRGDGRWYDAARPSSRDQRAATPAPASPTDGRCRASSTRSSPPRKSARAPGWVWPSPTGSSRSTAGRSAAANATDGGAVFTISCRRRTRRVTHQRRGIR